MHPSAGVISILQAGRALAALAVLFHHAGRYTHDLVAGFPPLLNAIAERGYLGVDFFFVLSGFIIYHTNFDRAPTSAWSARYLESRLVRIFVPYLPVGIAVAIGYTLLPGLSGADRDWDWLATLTLLPTTTEPALLVAWTLQHELFFYFVFWVFALSGRPILAAAVWAAVIVAWFLASGGPPKPFFTMFALINVEFLFGMVAARLVRTGRVSSNLLALGAIAALGAYAALGAAADHRVVFGVAMALLLVPIVRLEQADRVRVPASLVTLGDASYALYLVHLPLLALLARALPGHWAAALLWQLVAGTLFGLLYHYIYERPAIAAVRGRLAKLRLRGSPEPGGAT